MQGQYDHDFRRFGESYAQGDQTARDSMKDIIINLQMALITSLHEALQTDLELNYESLLIASDNTRTNAIVCLGQLHQRLASRSRQPPSSQATELPAGTPATQLPSRPVVEMDIPNDPYRPTSPQPPPPYDPRSSDPPVELPTGGGYNHDPAPAPPSREADDRTSSPTRKPRRSSSISSTFSFRRRWFSHGPKETEHGDQGVDHAQHPIIPVNEYSSEQDYRAGQAPEAISPDQARSPSHATDPMSIVSPIDQASRVSRGWTNISGVSFYSPDDVTNSNPWTIPFSPTSDHNMARSPPPNGPQQPDTQQAANQGLIVASSPRRHTFNNTPTRNNTTRGSTSGTSTTSSTNEGLTSYSSGGGGTSVSKSPYMPSEENKFAGFCKGAWKIQNNMKGAMTAEHRPSGMYGEIRFWKCCKCRFDGPMFGGYSKSTRKFDTKIRVDISGIRYRWLFLAKSHVPLKREPTVSDGSGGSFGCIFCCAEWKQKAPVFKDLEEFMEHLQIHREQVLSPELIYRTKCIVGRIAADSEDFDINLPPKAQEIG